MKTLTNCTILTIDKQDRFFSKGRMQIQDHRILAVGDEDKIPLVGEVIDLKGGIVMPGLIDTHVHSHSTIFRSQSDDLRLMDWLRKAMWPMEKYLTPEIAYAATALSCLELLKAGVTTYVDQFYFSNVIAHAAKASRIRCFLGSTVFTDSCAETDNTLQAAVDFIEAWRGKETETLVYPCLGPHAPYSVSEEIFREIADISGKYGVLIHTHISETQDENEQIFAKTGTTPTKWLESLGLFDHPVLAAHSIHLTDEDLEIFKRSNTHVTYNPVSNMKLASGVMPYMKMKQMGIPVSLGTDGAQSNNSLDLLRDLREGALLQKVTHMDPTVFSSRDGVRMVTIEGARAIGMESELGSLEPGKLADLIVLNPASVRLTPFHRDDLEHMYGTITYSACGADVSDVMVNGNWVMKDRQVLTFHEAEVLTEGQKASEYLVRKAFH